MADEGWDAAFLAVGAQLAHRTYLPAGLGRAGARRRVRCSTGWRRASGRCSAAGSRSTAAATPPSTPPGRPGAWAPPTPSSSTGAPASGCRPTTRRSREAEEEGIRLPLALHHRAGRRPTASSSSRWSSTRTASPSPPGAPRGWRPTAWCSRSARTPTSRSWATPPASRSRDGTIDTDSAFATTRSRRLRRRRRGGGGALGHGRHRARPPGGREHRRLAAGQPARTRPVRSTWRRTRP